MVLTPRRIYAYIVGVVLLAFAITSYLETRHRLVVEYQDAISGLPACTTTLAGNTAFESACKDARVKASTWISLAAFCHMYVHIVQLIYANPTTSGLVAGFTIVVWYLLKYLGDEEEARWDGIERRLSDVLTIAKRAIRIPDAKEEHEHLV